MSTSRLILLFIALLLLRPIMSFVDIFIVIFVLRLLLEPNRAHASINAALIASGIVSLLLDSPLGILPLTLSLTLLVFSSLEKVLTPKGIPALVTWSAFAFLQIVVEATAQFFFATAALSILPDALTRGIITVLVILTAAFFYTFKRKL